MHSRQISGKVNLFKNEWEQWICLSGPSLIYQKNQRPCILVKNMIY